MQTKQPEESLVTECDEPSRPTCGSIVQERNHYFTGKFLTARDLTAEQDYFTSRRWLHNRLLHGWGIVCGLGVDHHPNERCKHKWLVVRSGIAVDGEGRELVLCKDTAVPLPIPDAGAATSNATAQAAPHPRHGPYLLCLRYREERVERVPVLCNEELSDASRHEHNRVREVAEVFVCALEEAGQGCWPSPSGDKEAGCQQDCGDPYMGPTGACIEPPDICGGMVPVALVRVDLTKTKPEERLVIETEGRHELPPPPKWLTHVVHTNWRHGESIRLSRLRDQMNGRLEISFDRKIKRAQEERDVNDVQARRRRRPENEGTGINEHTFVVQLGGVERTLEFVPYEEGIPPFLDEGDCKAVFQIESAVLGRRSSSSIIGHVVYVTLRCDFILDCHDNPVDGEFLRGLLPTGDGRAGGAFMSWFRVEPDREEEEAK